MPITRRELLRSAGVIGVAGVPLARELGALAESEAPIGDRALPAGQPTQDGAGNWAWYQTDTHVHSVVSADAVGDLGVVTAMAKANGYDAIFLTDHNYASSFTIQGIDAYTLTFTDNRDRWENGVFGAAGDTVNRLATSPVHQGRKSLYLETSSTGYRESFVWARRGPNLRSGRLTIKFSVFPTRIDDGSSVYVSASIGGDPTATEPAGYTTRTGEVRLNKSIVLVWYLGAPPARPASPDQDVMQFTLGNYRLNAWNHFTIDVTEALNDISFAARPLDYNALTHLKMTAAANGGTVKTYFDGYAAEASAPQEPGEEFVDRNSVIHRFDTSHFRVFPSLEMGQRSHCQRFNFDISRSRDFAGYEYGTDGIEDAQASGYPVMLNHPGYAGGVSRSDAIAKRAFGAEILEVRERPWREVWDILLGQGVPIIGSFSSDTHSAPREGYPATFIYAPAFQFDEFIHSLYEGRVYDADNNFGGHIVFNLDPASAAPYPARYPVYLAGKQRAVDVHLVVTALEREYAIRWNRNGAVLVEEIPGATSYDAMKRIDLPKQQNFVRTEVLTSKRNVVGLTQALLFVKVEGLPKGVWFHVERVATANGRNYTARSVRGITSASWESTRKALALTVDNPVASVTTLAIHTPHVPKRLEAGGVTVRRALTQAQFDAAPGSVWLYVPATQLLQVKLRHSSREMNLLVALRITAEDTSPPTAPPLVTATPLSHQSILVGWAASSDDRGVAGYRVRRNGHLVSAASLPKTSRSYTDTGLTPSTEYAYTVEAFDAAGNKTRSAPVSATTEAKPTVFTAVADAYVSADSRSVNYGGTEFLRADSDGTRSYVRFNVTGLAAPITNARLRVFANKAAGTGYEVRVAANTWSEDTITFDSAPEIGPVVVSSGAYPAETYTEVEVTSLVSGNGEVSLAITTSGQAQLNLASRESANPPLLLVYA